MEIGKRENTAEQDKMEVDEEQCFLCNAALSNEECSTLTNEGVQGIHRVCKERKISDFHVNIGQRVHKKCRARFVNLKASFNILPTKSPDICGVRSKGPSFLWKENCLFCGEKVTQRHILNNQSFFVRTTSFHEHLLRDCDERNDQWAMEVRYRIQSAVSDLHAADACYHQMCSVNFRTGKLKPCNFSSRPSQLTGRPEDKERYEAFLHVAQYLEENDEEQITVNDLVNKMSEYLQNNNEALLPYSNKYMKKKLLDHFQDDIVITTVARVKNIVTFRKKAVDILRDHYKSPRTGNTEENKRDLILAAAHLIRSDMKEMEVVPHEYASVEDILHSASNTSHFPDSLRTLLQVLVTGKDKASKVSSIGQAIAQAVRPRVMLQPLQLGLGVLVHFNTGSRFLVDTLHSMGFSCSYAEVLQFSRCSAEAIVNDLPGYSPGSFIQYAADNVDHNIATLDGHGTFHGMGIIAMITPGISISAKVERKCTSVKEIADISRINIKIYPSTSTGLRLLKYAPLENDTNFTDTSKHIDTLWAFSPAPQWHGFCQEIHKGDHPGTSVISVLPMIDMDPTNLSCIYSTLQYICDQAKMYNHTPIITFDQPLFLKALSIISNEPPHSPLKQIILRLGGFHTLMSFLGCVGHIMAGSGLEEILQIFYACNAVKHMLTGKAFARAVRGHFIVYASLCTIIAEETCTGDDICKARSLVTDLLNSEVDFDTISKSEALINLEKCVSTFRSSVKENRTSMLWLQYMKMIEILRNFIKAERLGIWHLHLQSLKEMLPFFAAAGHNAYAKSAYLYFQDMVELSKSAPNIYEQFCNGLHVVRRSNRLWAGLSPDLVIEQVYMKGIKGSGGLTHGRGMTEEQRALWVGSRPVCSQINMAMQEFAGTSHVSSEQHISITSARQKRDKEDTDKVLQFIRTLDIFSSEISLRNIVSGVTAEAHVNADQAEVIGERILTDMIGHSVTEYSFKRSEQVKTLHSKHSINCEGESFHIDPELLFQRCLVTAQTNQISLNDTLSYELTTFPAALFDSSGLMRESVKSLLAKHIQKRSNSAEIPSGDLQFVLDGGALLQRIPWEKNATFYEVSMMYINYVLKRYGKCSIVFDGYSEELSTKVHTHLRRQKGKRSQNVLFQPQTVVVLSKADFLSNIKNKERFITYLSEMLKTSGCRVFHAVGDADLMIVQESVKSANKSTTVVVGDDTDLLILLIHHSKNAPYDIFLCPEPKPNAKDNFKYNIRRITESLGENITSHILFAHALLGCDTTSRLFSISKVESINALSFEDFRNQAAVFSTSGKSNEEIVKAGELALAKVYGGQTEETLDQLRVRLFIKKVSESAKHVKPEILPPTSDSCSFHSMRVYHQVQAWLGVTIDPLQWGWVRKDNKLSPIKSSKPPAPSHLLKLIRCGCKLSHCSTMLCSCKKQGLLCTAACGDCRGISCMNSDTPTFDDNDIGID